MRRTPLHLLVLPVATLALTQTAGAQSQSRENLTGVWALTNARIETVTKGTIERGTVVIRDGVIEAVGATVTVPADARVVDLSGKTIAPAFIDLTSSLGLRAPAQQGGGGRGAAAPGPIPGFPNAEPDVQTETRVVGLEPDRVVAEELNLSPADARTERDQGIGVALISPSRGLFRGLSALLPMRDDTASRWILKSPVALHVGYQTVPGDYPSNLLGVIAYQRQAFYDAQRHALVMDRYKANPRGMPRTAHNAELEALVPVVKGDIPVFIAANNENEMLRALALGKEFNLKVTLVGAVEGFRAVSALKAARPPIVTVDFPQPAQTTGWQYQYSVRNDPSDSSSRSATVTKEIEGNAATLNTAGIKFALASGGLAANMFMDNVRKAIAAGLPRSVALEALTIRAAEVAGVDAQLGSIEVGKIANLQVVNGEPLAASARLESVYIDGLQYDVIPSAAGRGGRGGRANNPPQMREE
jgi:imidazolonepropionase-like amidohydrolase